MQIHICVEQFAGCVAGSRNVFPTKQSDAQVHQMIHVSSLWTLHVVFVYLQRVLRGLSFQYSFKDSFLR